MKTKYKIGLLLVVLFAAGVLLSLLVKTETKAVAETAYGEQLQAEAVSDHEDRGFAARNAANNSGMSGTIGKQRTHNKAPRGMWRTQQVSGGEVAITFDLGRVESLSEMWIWNYNEQAANTGRGLRKVAIFHSADGAEWQEWKGFGYPFELAKADGAVTQKATNLADGKGPVLFGGLPARYIKLVAKAEPNEGNWGGKDGSEAVFGLSEVVFYKRVVRPMSGDAISAGVAGPEDIGAYNLVNDYGMSGRVSLHDTHDNDSDGRSMWLWEPAADEREVSVTFDLGGTYPLKEMRVWNYNRVTDAGSREVSYEGIGLKRIRVEYSLNARNWQELKGDGYPYELAKADGSSKLKATNLNDGKRTPISFGNAPVRYVRITVANEPGAGNWGGLPGKERQYGLSEVRFICGEGIAAEPAPEWDALFSRYLEWTGADGIFSIPLSGDERSAADKAEDEAGAEETLFLFSDTFIGQVDPVAKSRISGKLVNNTMAVLEGSEPDSGKLRFLYGSQGQGLDTNAMIVPDLEVLKPSTDGQAEGEPVSYWYWLQDGIVLDGKLHLLPLLMKNDPGGEPGFQFAIDGVGLVKVPLDSGNGFVWEQAEQHATPLFARSEAPGDHHVFGAGILPNTKAAGVPSPDGYVYVYGYKDGKDNKQLLAARVRPEDFGSFDKWTYWDGAAWSTDIRKAAALADQVSPELSVTPMTEGRFAGKYLLVYQKGTVGSETAFRVGDHPWGPFGPETVLFSNTHAEGGKGIFTYNAKAHPHLSEPGELLITYNVNSADGEANMADADIYRPRWIRVREIPER